MIRIKAELLEEVIQHLRSELPNEGCGLLAGRGGEVLKVYRLRNVERSPYSYLADPKEQIKAMKEIRELGLEMVGIYHSHVSTPPYPSRRDVELVFYPDVSYLIVSFQNPSSPLVKSFRIKEGKVEEEEIKVIGGEGDEDISKWEGASNGGWIDHFGPPQKERDKA